VTSDNAINFFIVLPFFRLLLDAEIFGGWLERNPVNALFRQLNGIQMDAADVVSLLLH